MKRGDVWWVNFDPSVGGEIKKRRPAIIVSNDASKRKKGDVFLYLNFLALDSAV